MASSGWCGAADYAADAAADWAVDVAHSDSPVPVHRMDLISRVKTRSDGRDSFDLNRAALFAGNLAPAAAPWLELVF